MNSRNLALCLGLIAANGCAIAGGGPYPDPALEDLGPGKTRAEVIAEMQEARRLGLLHFGESDPPIATAEQEVQIAEAGRRAREAIEVARAARADKKN
jgi:Domain of unknown function (DUF4148)